MKFRKEKKLVKNETKVAKKPSKKKIRITICVVIAVLLIWMGYSCSNAAQNMGALVTTATATRGELQESINTSGSVSSEYQEVVFAEVGGKLAEVNIAAGDGVKAGDVLIAYDMKSAEEELKQASLQQDKSEASYQAILADNNKSQAKLSEANINLAVLDKQITGWKEHLKKLEDELSEHKRQLENSLASESYDLGNQSAELDMQIQALDKTAPDYDAKAAQLQEKRKDLNEEISYNQYKRQVVGSSDYVAELEQEIAKTREELAGFEEYKAEMEGQKSSSEGTVMNSYDKKQYSADNELAALSYQSAEDAYQKAKNGVVASFDGIVMKCNAVEGATVTEGMELLTLANSEEIKVVFNTSKIDVEKLKVGQKASVTISGNVYEGTVSKINRMASLNESNTPMVGVEVHIDNPDEKIILGIDAKLEIYTNKVEDALLIPVEAINADKEGDFLYVVEKGVVVKKNIVCGISSDTYAEIVEGITEQDQIIVSSMNGIEEGMQVTIMPQQ